MLKNIQNFLIKYNISNKNLMAAFSGGYDSTVLLNILLKLRNILKFNLYAIHLNHNWRGKESDKEEIFCKEFCEKNNITFFSKKIPENSTSNEIEAREERYNFFKEIYKKEKIDFLLTAHTKSDNAETLIYRLAKGTGIKGLKGIQEYVEMMGMKILRPMINVSRQEIEEYINKNNLNVNFDSSNKNKKYLRNKVRLDVVPQFKEICSTFEDNILNTSKIAGFYDDAIEFFLEKEKIFDLDGIKTSEFLNCNENVQRIILYKFLEKNNIETKFKQIELLLEEIKSKITKSGKYFSLSDTKFILIRPDKIEIVEKKDNNVSNYKFVISEENKDIKQFPNGTKSYIYADKEAIKEPLSIRKRQDGDIFQPFGMQGTMKLKKFLNMKAIPKMERDNLVLLTNSDNQILWIYPLATSEIVRVKNKNFVRIDIKDECFRTNK